MLGEQRLPFVLYAVCTAALLAQGSQGTIKYLLIEMLIFFIYEYAFLKLKLKLLIFDDHFSR